MFEKRKTLRLILLKIHQWYPRTKLRFTAEKTGNTLQNDILWKKTFASSFINCSLSNTSSAISTVLVNVNSKSSDSSGSRLQELPKQPIVISKLYTGQSVKRQTINNLYSSQAICCGEKEQRDCGKLK